ncbi:MAG: alanine racemase [Myxococcota bacterium]|nr:alanine racemase [Myxococcota bacterium]
MMGHSVETMRVEVDLNAIVSNARDVQALVGPSTGVLAVMKADAYGHGLVPVARALERDRVVAGFVVTSLASGVSLRREGIDLPVIALIGQYGRGHSAVIEAGLTPVLASIADVESFALAARLLGRRIAAHVEVDTGMSRLGIREDEIARFLATLAACPEITITGLCTQLASADSDSPAPSHRQLDAFEQARDLFVAAGHRPTMVHAANTAATFRLPRSHFSHVRAGIALFGGDEPSGATLRPSMRLVTRVAQLRSIRAGEAVSYGEAWRAARPSQIATLPVGYAQGYPRRLSGRTEVLIRERRVPVVGSICMEMMMVDVTDLGDDVHVDDEVVLLGGSGVHEIRATDLARSMGGIVEEIFCGIPKTMVRTYSPDSATRIWKDFVRDTLIPSPAS